MDSETFEFELKKIEIDDVQYRFNLCITVLTVSGTIVATLYAIPETFFLGVMKWFFTVIAFLALVISLVLDNTLSSILKILKEIKKRLYST